MNEFNDLLDDYFLSHSEIQKYRKILSNSQMHNCGTFALNSENTTFSCE